MMTICDSEQYETKRPVLLRGLSRELGLAVLLLGSMGAITWAVRGTNGWGGVDGTVLPGMTWGLLWYYVCHRMGIDGRGVSFWLGLGIALGGALGYGQYISWIQGKFYFQDQIVPVEVKKRKETVMFTTDEHVRGDATLEGMAKLRTVFKKDGTVTAGNASGINDAAAAVVLAERQVAEAKGLKPVARLIGYSFAGVEPEYMGIGPVPAVKKLLAKTGMTINDMDVFEVNEAFAAQALAVCRDLDLPSERTNPNGSGISLGHPIGATGCIITVKAIHELQRTGGRFGLITMCIGGGQGIAAIIERM